MNIAAGAEVRVIRDIERMDESRRRPYVRRGDTGVVKEVFAAQSMHSGDDPIWHAKVLINGRLRTLRLTSIEVIR